VLRKYYLPHFIFIGDENPFPKAYEKAWAQRKRESPDQEYEGSEEAHIRVFCTLYEVFDIETRKKYWPCIPDESKMIEDVDLYDILNPALAAEIERAIAEYNDNDDEETRRRANSVTAAILAKHTT